MKNFSYSVNAFDVNKNEWFDRIVTMDEDKLLSQMRFWTVTQYQGKTLRKCFEELVDKWNGFEIIAESRQTVPNRKKITYVALPENYVKEFKQVDFV